MAVASTYFDPRERNKDKNLTLVPVKCEELIEAVLKGKPASTVIEEIINATSR